MHAGTACGWPSPARVPHVRREELERSLHTTTSTLTDSEPARRGRADQCMPRISPEAVRCHQGPHTSGACRQAAVRRLTCK